MMATLNFNEVMQWSVDDVLYWLERNNLSEFGELVVSGRIDGPDFIKLDKARITNCRNVPKNKKDLLWKHLKDFEKEKNKMQKSMKQASKTTNGRMGPVPPAAITVRSIPPPRPVADDEDEYEFDENEWDEDDDFYDSAEGLRPPEGRRSEPPLPPPPSLQPNDSDEDYETPNDPPPIERPSEPPTKHIRLPVMNVTSKQSRDPAPTGRPPPPPPVNDDSDDLYEKANLATIPCVAPPPRSLQAQTLRSAPPFPAHCAQGSTGLPARGGPRTPVAPSHQPILYEDPISPALPPPMSRSNGPIKSTQPKTSPALPPRRNSPPPVPRPSASTVSTAPKSSAPSSIRERPPFPAPAASALSAVPPPAPQEDPEAWYELTNEMKGPPSRALPPRPSSEVYTDPNDQFDDIYETAPDGEEDENAAPSAVGLRGRAPLPSVPTIRPPSNYELTDPVPRSLQNEKLPFDDENYESTESYQEANQAPPPPPSATNRSSGPRQRPPPPRPDEEENYEAADDMSSERDDDVPPPPKPEKLHLGSKLLPGISPVGIGLSAADVVDARCRLKTAPPKDSKEVKVSNDKSSLQEVKGVGGIKEMLGLQAKSPPQLPHSKTTKVNAPKTAAFPPPPAFATEIHAPGAPEPPIRNPDSRVPPPGPPGGPPETKRKNSIVATPAEDPNDIKTQPWYFGDCGRDVANKKLMESAEGGTYLVRDSKGSGQPYTLCIYYERDIFNISIRRRPDGKFALGTQKPDEHIFETIYDLVRFHRNNAIEISKSGVLAGKVRLAKVAEK